MAYTNSPMVIYTKLSPNRGGQAHSNMPPYLAIYMWKRTG
jgi:hypothetical protein